MLILSGYGCGLRIEKDALVVKQGINCEKERQATILYRGVHGIRSIILCAYSGSLTLDAIKWCTEQSITVTMLDRDGNLVQALTPLQESNALLRRAQYRAMDNGKANRIAAYLVRDKISGQLETLLKHPQLPQRDRAIEILTNAVKWFHLEKGLPSWLLDIIISCNLRDERLAPILKHGMVFLLNGLKAM